jgi:hypothetical protein
MHCPSQIPEHFIIQPLPNEITSWLTALLLRLPVKLQLQEKHTRTKLGRGHDRQPTAAGLDSQTHSLTTSHATHESNSSGPSPWLCGKPAHFSRSSHVRLAKGSISSAIPHVCQTFGKHGRPDPSLDNDGKTGILLQ